MKEQEIRDELFKREQEIKELKHRFAHLEKFLEIEFVKKEDYVMGFTYKGEEIPQTKIISLYQKKN